MFGNEQNGSNQEFDLLFRCEVREVQSDKPRANNYSRYLVTFGLSTKGRAVPSLLFSSSSSNRFARWSSIPIRRCA